jgi:Rrf2 family protein
VGLLHDFPILHDFEMLRQANGERHEHEWIVLSKWGAFLLAAGDASRFKAFREVEIVGQIRLGSDSHRFGIGPSRRLSKQRLSIAKIVLSALSFLEDGANSTNKLDYEVRESGFRPQTPEWMSIMLTKKGKYGLKAAVHLARLPIGQSAFVADVAQANMIPKKFLDAILGELRNAGMLHSKKGKGGGYMLAKPAESIIVGDIVRVLDGPLAPLSCASTTAYHRCDDCSDENTCTVRLMMLAVRNAITDVLDRHTLAEMRDLTGDFFEVLTHHSVSEASATIAAVTELAKA